MAYLRILVGITKTLTATVLAFEDQSGTTKITDLLVEGVSLRTTHRSDFASAIQSNGGTVAGLLDALRQKVKSQ